MKILPEYTFDTAPAPKIIVIPAQDGNSKAMRNWIRKSSKDTDVTMSVCTGSYVLASTGLLSGRPATTFHNAYNDFEATFPDIQVERGMRFVETGNLATSGGLSAGIDLALRITERYFGREIARQTALYLEYQGEGWMHPNSNRIYNERYPQSDQHPVCPVCGMEPSRSLQSVYKGKTYYFCMQNHKAIFDRLPGSFISE
jgi:YHS domain-containing protein